MRAFIVFALLTVLSAATAAAQGLDEVKAKYTKYEYAIPMRDGAKLHTAVYAPKDSNQRYPILLTRTPYSCKPYGVDRYPANLGPSPAFGREGYIFAYQDVRGRWNSEGTFVNMRPEKDGVSPADESTDTYDTIDWLVKHVAGNNGRVGMYGISYPGYYTACGLIDAHPALKAASPQAPVTDWFVGDDWHHNGAFLLTHCFNFLSVFGHPRPEPTRVIDAKFDHGTPDGYDFFLGVGPLANIDKNYFKGDVAFWNEVMDHPTYDSWWQARNVRPHLKQVKPAVLTVGGWFDAENLFGALECYKSIERQSPGANNSLVMGPWIHGGWAGGDGAALGPVSFNAKTSEEFREKIQLPFFNWHLKGAGGTPPSNLGLTEAIVFETGTNRWRRLDAWPPKSSNPKSLYLQANGALTFDAPTSDGYDEYVSDPAHPVPYLNATDTKMAVEYMTADQRFASRRTDVLSYATAPLTADLALAGPVKVVLHVATTGTDADFVVKLIDVFPNDAPDPEPNPEKVRMGGYQQLLRGDVMRGKFRRGLDRPEAFTPGEPAEVTFTLQDVCHVFRPGHRLMVQVQSSWFPLIDRNPQTFVDIYKAKPEDFRKATQRVYRSASQASRLELPVDP